MTMNSLCHSPDSFKVCGDLNDRTVIALLDEGSSFLQQCAGQCMFDLSGVTYSNSVGIALLLAWTREARILGKQITFCCMPEYMQALLEISDLEGVISVKPA